MDDLHIRLPADLKHELKRYCREQNIAVTSAIIMMIVRELQEGNLTYQGSIENAEVQPLGFILQQ